MRYPVLLFDLFRTILLFTRHAPTGQVKEPTWRPAMQELCGRAQTLLGGVEFDFFLDALCNVSLVIAKAQPPEHRETPIAVRYARTLARLGLDAQAANTELRTAHRTLLLALARHGLDELLTTAVISIDVDRRKPHPEIFRETLRRLDLQPGDALMIGDSLGDSLGDDVGGAAAAGIDSAWVNWHGASAPAAGPQPTHAVGTLAEVAELLA